MKTSNKTNRRFLGIAVVMMVLNLVAVNLNAQKSYNENTFVVTGSEFFMNLKSEIVQAISETITNNTVVDEQPIEDWMINPSAWGKNKPSTTEADFEEVEMILEDWMMKANWEDSSFIEEELRIEDWMTNPVTWNNVK